MKFLHAGVSNGDDDAQISGGRVPCFGGGNVSFGSSLDALNRLPAIIESPLLQGVSRIVRPVVRIVRLFSKGPRAVRPRAFNSRIALILCNGVIDRGAGGELDELYSRHHG